MQAIYQKGWGWIVSTYQKISLLTLRATTFLSEGVKSLRTSWGWLTKKKETAETPIWQKIGSWFRKEEAETSTWQKIGSWFKNALVSLSGVAKSLWILLVKFAKEPLRVVTPIAKRGWAQIRNYATPIIQNGWARIRNHTPSVNQLSLRRGDWFRLTLGVFLLGVGMFLLLSSWRIPSWEFSLPSWLWLVALALLAFNFYRLGIRHPFRAFFRAVWQTIVIWVVFSIVLWGWRALGIPEKLPSFPTDIEVGWWVQQPHLILLALSSVASLGLWMGLKNEGFRRRHAGLLPGETFLNYTTSSERLVYFSRFYKRVLSAQRRSILFVAPIVILWLARAQGNVVGDPWWLWVYEGLPALLVTIALAAVSVLDPAARSSERHPSFQRLNLWDYLLVLWGLIALFSTFQYVFW